MNRELRREHAADLERSGIDRDYARAAGMHTSGSALAIPYYDINGKRLGFARFRHYDGGPKYKQPRGSKPHLYLPVWPGSPSKWRRIARDLSVDVFVVEGEKKAACAVMHGIPCVGIGGVDCFAVPEWDEFVLKGRKVTLIPDSDQEKNPNVRAATLRQIAFFEERGAIVFVGILPTLSDASKTGLDDYLVAKGRKAFDAHVPIHSARGEYIASWANTTSSDSLPAMKLEPVPKNWLMDDPPAVEYTWAPLIVRGTVVVLAGPGGVGKSYLTMGLSMAVAAGHSFLGRPTTRGPVVYLAMEDPAAVLRRRAYYTRRHFGPNFDERALHENLIFESLAGHQLHLIGTSKGNVVQSLATAQLIERLKPLRPELVVLDPMARLHGADENANAVGTAVINAVEQIAQGVGCAVLLCHHTGKQNAADKRDDVRAVRGASAIADAARGVMVLHTVDRKNSEIVLTEEDPEVLKLSHAKNSYGPREREIWLARASHGVLERYTPTFKKLASDFDQWEPKFRVWAAKAGEFTRRSAERDANQIDANTGDKATRKFFDQAVAAGLLELCGQRKGGQLYRLKQTKAKP